LTNCSTSVRCDALLFDLDGTLIDSRRDIAAACNATLTRYGRAPLAEHLIMPMVGDGARALIARAFASAEEDPIVDRALVTFKQLYLERPCEKTTLLPGAREALDLGVPCAVVTNKPREVTLVVLEALGLGTKLRAIWAGGDGRLKPAPDGVRAVLAELGVDAARAWVVGDGPQDIAAGRAAGCFTVAVPGIAERDVLLAARPHLVVESLLEVADRVRSVNSTGSAAAP
jgi:HAD superfamily hydrolase (TIGR01509 family)